jgi:hypothetical protein
MRPTARDNIQNGESREDTCHAFESVSRGRLYRGAGVAGPRAEPAGEPACADPGTIEKLGGHVLTVKSRDGPQVTITLAPNVTVAYLVKKSLADIKAGDFVASTSTRGTDGKNHSLELRIFPEAMRGAGEGQYAWDLIPESTMTNATVSGVTGAPQGETLRVSYKGGESELVVGPDTPIFGYGTGDMSLLKPGAAVFIVAQKQADGS